MASILSFSQDPDFEAEKAVSDDVAILIGKFVVAWGSVERELELFVTAIYFVPPFQRAALTAGLAIDAKITSIRSGIGLFSGQIKPTCTKECLKVLDDLRDLNHEARNFIFHWGVIVDENKQLRAHKIKPGNTVKMVIVPLTAEYFEFILVEIAFIRMRLRRALVNLKQEINPLKESYEAQQAERNNAKRARKKKSEPGALLS